MSTPRLIEAFPIRLPDGTSWEGSLFQSPHRRTGRQIVVHDQAGTELFDTGCCYDLGNAMNTLDLWLAKQLEGQVQR